MERAKENKNKIGRSANKYQSHNNVDLNIQVHSSPKQIVEHFWR